MDLLLSKNVKIAVGLDQGIIRSFKAHYGKALMRKMITRYELHADLSEFTKEIAVLDAIPLTITTEMIEELEVVFEELSLMLTPNVPLDNFSDVDENLITDDNNNDTYDEEDDVEVLEEVPAAIITSAQFLRNLNDMKEYLLVNNPSLLTCIGN
uniref:Reverse transcriptase domain-containing protein n=1 Tax=Rhabditophanes sp. KR3021 TaxID=114890 RepID=A0AC35THX3_9BILA